MRRNPSRWFKASCDGCERKGRVACRPAAAWLFYCQWDSVCVNKREKRNYRVALNMDRLVNSPIMCRLLCVSSKHLLRFDDMFLILLQTAKWIQGQLVFRFRQRQRIHVICLSDVYFLDSLSGCEIFLNDPITSSQNPTFLEEKETLKVLTSENLEYLIRID